MYTYVFSDANIHIHLHHGASSWYIRLHLSTYHTHIFKQKHHKTSPQNITITSIHHHITKHRFKYKNSSPKTKLELSHFKTDSSSNRKKPNKPHKNSHPQPTRHPPIPHSPINKPLSTNTHTHTPRLHRRVNAWGLLAGG